MAGAKKTAQNGKITFGTRKPGKAKKRKNKHDKK